jgi:hypothetical protein
MLQQSAQAWPRRLVHVPASMGGIDPELLLVPELPLDELVPPLDPVVPLDPPEPELLPLLPAVWSAPASEVPGPVAAEPPQAIACAAAQATPDNAK